MGGCCAGLPLSRREDPALQGNRLVCVSHGSIDPAEANAVYPLIGSQLHPVSLQSFINELDHGDAGHVVQPNAFHFSYIIQSLLVVEALFAAVGQSPKLVITLGSEGVVPVCPSAAVYLQAVPRSQLVGGPTGKAQVKGGSVCLGGTDLLIGLGWWADLENQFEAVGAEDRGPAALECFSVAVISASSFL